MRTHKLNWFLLLRIAVAIICLTALAGVAGSSLAPGTPVAKILLYSLVGSLIFLALLLTLAAMSVSWAKFSINHGGTDPQWFWFAAEPQGMASVREQLAAESSKPGNRAQR